MLPDFIGIGPARSATTWLYENLNLHPEIGMAKWDKKTHFFDLYYENGVDWYERFFFDLPEGCVKGELTETYIFYDEIPERIHRHCPDVKIFTCLRNPVDRAFSAYLHLIRDGAIKESFEQAVTAHEKILITDSLYYDRLKPYFEFFPKDQIKIFFFEDVITRPADVLKDMYGFLGVDDMFLPEDPGKKFNETMQPRFPIINKVMLLSHLWLRDRDLYKYVLPLKETKLIKMIRFRQGNAPLPEMALETRMKLHDIFDPQIEQLSEFVDRDLSGWLKAQDNILNQLQD